MSKKVDGKEDWVKRGEGRTPTKGAMAAERASAGLGTSDDDDGVSPLFTAPATRVWTKRAPKAAQPQKPAPRR